MKLSDYLQQPNVTAAGLARKAEVSPSTIGRWADGTVQPSLAGMRRLYDATGGLVTPNDFLAISVDVTSSGGGGTIPVVEETEQLAAPKPVIPPNDAAAENIASDFAFNRRPLTCLGRGLLYALPLSVGLWGVIGGAYWVLA